MAALKCHACQDTMRYLKEFRFDSRDNNRGLLAVVFNAEEHLVMDVFVCPTCHRLEFIYKGSHKQLDL